LHHKTLSNEEILQCLERSGYLLESLIVRELVNQGYFVEPNQVVLDPRTGKSRELDMVAEYFSFEPSHKDTCVKTYFVAEVINNKFPVVLLTRRPSTPNSIFESYVKYGCTPEQNDFYVHLDYLADRSPPEERLFAQYCSLTSKKGSASELMASHSEDMYASLLKIAEYVEHQLEGFADFPDGSNAFWRIFFWHPMLVLGGQLFTVEDSDASAIGLSEASSAFLEFNWHQEGEPRTTVVEVITVTALYERMGAIVSYDEALEVKLHALHAKTDK